MMEINNEDFIKVYDRLKDITRKYTILKRFIRSWFEENRVLTADVADIIIYALEPDEYCDETDDSDPETVAESGGSYYDE